MFLSDYVGVSSLLTPPTDDSPIPYDVILEWIALILDVHFTHLTLDQECCQLLLSLQSQVFAQVRKDMLITDLLHENCQFSFCTKSPWHCDLQVSCYNRLLVCSSLSAACADWNPLDTGHECVHKTLSL